MRTLGAIIGLVLSLVALSSSPGHADGDATLDSASYSDWTGGGKDKEKGLTVSSGGHAYDHGCFGSNGVSQAVGCGQPCPGPPPGTWIDVFRDGELLETVCAADPTQPTVTPAMMQFEFEALTWPTAELVIQPPKGETFVNLETLFYTELAEDQRQTVTLLGHEITIVAAPAEYIWHSGEANSEPWSTTDPSHRLRDDERPEDLNHYVYSDADVTVRPSVDVVYQGRFQVDGGEWQDIPETLTVTGNSESLDVREAHGLLLDY